MSIAHSRAAWAIQLPSLTKLVLLALADHACEACGLAWPGTRLLTEKTGMGATRLREALDALSGMGLLQVHAYPKGGRGKATEYVVLPKLPGLFTAPCGKCVSNQRNPPPREGYDNSVTAKPTATRWVSGKPTANPPETHRTGGDQPSVNLQPPRARAREVEPSASPAAAATPPVSSPTPLSPPENAAKARELLDALAPSLGPPSTRTGKHGGRRGP